MKKIVLTGIVWICLLMSLPLAACNGGAVVSECALSAAELSMNINDEERLDLITEGMIIADGIQWKSSDERIVTVRDGLVGAKNEGSAIVTAEYCGQEYLCNVSVIAKELVLSDSRLALEVGGEHELVLKENGVKIDKGITWRSSDEAVISVDNGHIKALATGESIVTARYGERSFVCNIIVREPFDSIGKYYAKIYVAEMDVTFEFDLFVNEDGTYTYDRRANDFVEGMRVNSGTWTYVNRVLIFMHDEGEMRFTLTEDGSIASIGTIPTGGMDSELTFNKVQ